MITALVSLAGVVAALIQELRRRREAEARRDAEAEAKHYREAWQAAKAAGEADIARLESVIAGKRREVEELSNELESCGNPGAAFAITRRLLRDPWSGDHPAGPVPDGAAPAVGAGG